MKTISHLLSVVSRRLFGSRVLRQRLSLSVQVAADLMVVVGLFTALAAPSILAIEVGEWMLNREWDGLMLEDGLGLFGIDRNGLAETPAEQVLDVLLAIPLTLVMFIVGVLTLLTGVHLGDWGVHGAWLKSLLSPKPRRARSTWQSKPTGSVNSAAGEMIRHIVIVLPGLAAGGSEKVVNCLANRWATRGWNISVVSFDQQSAPSYYAYHPSVDLVRLGAPTGRRRPLVALAGMAHRVVELRRLLVDRRPDLVISFLTRTNVLVLLASAGLPRPVIVSERNNPELQPAGPFWGWLRARLYPHAFGLVTMTAGAMRYFEHRMKVRGWVIPNSVHLLRPQPTSTPGCRLVATGRLVPQKGFDMLLRAFASVARQFPDWQLVIWGEGPERVNLERQCRELGLEQRVELPGVSREPGSWIQSADAFVLSSRFEGWGIVLLEAMAAGLPVVSFDCAFGPAEMIEPDVSGLLVPAGDEKALALALARVMADPILRSSLGHQAARRARDFSPEQVLGMWDELIEEAVSSGRREVPSRRKLISGSIMLIFAMPIQ